MPRRFRHWSPTQGINGFYYSKDARLACCHARKVEPLRRALAGAGAWVTGLRADQSGKRAETRLADWDAEHALIKIAPLFDHDRERVAADCEALGVPVNDLHAQGFLSIGCAPCTRAVQPGEPERAGRWWWEDDERARMRPPCRCVGQAGAEQGGMSSPEPPSSRIAPLPNLPLFHQLKGRKAVVAGTSDGAAWKAELLAAAGADVVRLGAEWSTFDLKDTALAVGGFRRPSRGGTVRRSSPRSRRRRQHRRPARTQRRPVRHDRQPLADRRRHFDRRRGADARTVDPRAHRKCPAARPFPMGESGEGVAPAAQSQAHRFRGAPRLLAALRRLPPGPNLSASPPTSTSTPCSNSTPEPKGRVTLVGAGPGDPELLTLKAVRALQSATVILHDQLVGPEVLELARREARRIAVGKTGHGPSCKQSEINALLVELALAGENVVRLKGGDPLIFGRAAEEIDACRAAGIEVSVIPGISQRRAPPPRCSCR